MIKQLTPVEAIASFKAGEFEKLTKEERAYFQVNQKCLFMPFGVFHEAMEHTLDRPILLHEFADADFLKEQVEEALKRM